MASIWDYFTDPNEGEEAGQASSFWEYFTSDEPPDAQTVQSVQVSPCARFFNEEMVFWAMRNTPITEAVKHFLVCGAIGTGKTTTIDLFLQSIVPRFKQDRATPEQLIIFDAKCDIIPKLANWGLSLEDDNEKNNIWLINPYDKRSSTWAIAEAVKSPLMAQHFAAILVPEERQSTAPFFWTASRQLVYAAILALNRIAGSDWELRDLLCALTSRERITAITASHPRAKELAAAVLSDKQHSSGVVSTLATKLGHLEQVAALWHTAPKKKPFSIAKFLERPGVLILGNDPVLRESLWPINSMILKSLSKQILRGPEVRLPKHWFVLDEFPAMEQVESIHELVNRGRSKGASVLLGIQGLDRLTQLYDETGANDLLEQCSSKTFLRAGGPKTAEWIERFFGKYRRTESVHSESWSSTGRTASVQYNTVEQSIFLASFFMDLPFTGPGCPYVAVSDIPWLNKTLITRRFFDEVDSWRKKPQQGDKKVDTLQPRDDEADQTLEPWDADEIARFCPSKPKKKKSGDPKTKQKPEEPPLPTRAEIWRST